MFLSKEVRSFFITTKTWITIEAFNHYYLLSDESKYLDDNRMLIIDNVGGLVNTNEQTVSIIDPYGIEQTVAHYSGQDVSRLRSIKYQYPDDGTNEMEKVEAHARPTPGWLDPGQVPERPQYHTNQPAAPTGSHYPFQSKLGSFQNLRPICWMTPLFITAMRSEMASASS